MNISHMVKVETRGVDDQPRLVLVDPEDQDVALGIPLLDLSPLGLPEGVEAKVREALWAVGIKEYADALRPGAQDLIAAALRTALRASVQSVITLCQAEGKMLGEAGYKAGH